MARANTNDVNKNHNVKTEDCDLKKVRVKRDD